MKRQIGKTTPKRSSVAVQIASLLAAALLILAAAVSHAETSQCVFTDLTPSETCPVETDARSFELMGMGEETIIFVDKPKTREAVEKTSVVVSSRLEEAVLAGELDEEDAMAIGGELHGLSGARYVLPATRQEILNAVGFPSSAVIASEDWIEMIRVHAERALSLSAEASRFLLDQIGVESTVLSASPETEFKSDFTSESKSETVTEAEASIGDMSPVSNESNPVVIKAH